MVQVRFKLKFYLEPLKMAILRGLKAVGSRVQVVSNFFNILILIPIWSVFFIYKKEIKYIK